MIASGAVVAFSLLLAALAIIIAAFPEVGEVAIYLFFLPPALFAMGVGMFWRRYPEIPEWHGLVVSVVVPSLYALCSSISPWPLLLAPHAPSEYLFIYACLPVVGYVVGRGIAKIPSIAIGLWDLSRTFTVFILKKS